MNSSKCTFHTYQANKLKLRLSITPPCTIFTPSPSKSVLLASILSGSPVSRMIQFKVIVSSIEQTVSSLVCTYSCMFLNLVVQITPYCDVLHLNCWACHSIPLIPVIHPYWDFHLLPYKPRQTLWAGVIFHPSSFKNL